MRTAGRWARSRFRRRALILGYHRLRGDGTDPYGIEVSVDALRAQLRAVRDRARPVPLRELVRGLREGCVEDRSVAVTFDDAYAATLAELPELAGELDVPVTIFVPAELMGREPWWDELDRVLSVPRPLPGTLRLEAGTFTLSRDLDPEERVDPRGRRRLILDVYDGLRRLPVPVASELLPQVARWTGAEPEEGPRSVASPDVLRALAASAGFDIGSHSATHPFLADLPRGEQQRELSSSKGRLEELLSRPVELFSYPNGSFSDTTVELVQECGYLGACSSRPDVVTSQSDPLALPRLWPGDTPDEVSRMMRLWL